VLITLNSCRAVPVTSGEHELSLKNVNGRSGSLLQTRTGDLRLRENVALEMEKNDVAPRDGKYHQQQRTAKGRPGSVAPSLRVRDDLTPLSPTWSDDHHHTEDVAQEAWAKAICLQARHEE
jgi:hypothetical protein